MNDNSNLEFRKVKSLYFLYEVSEDGRFLRNIKSKKYIRIRLDMHNSKSGYYACFVCIKGKVKRVMMHKIVAECWLGEKPEGFEIDHIDRNTHNNHYTNLRYVTHSEQMKNRVISDRIIEQATKNCLIWVAKISKPVEISKGEVKIKFPSMTKASEYISEKTGKNSGTIRDRMKKRRKNIFGYDITYLNAETGHAGLKRQGTVQ